MNQRQKVLGVPLDNALRGAIEKAACRAGNAVELAKILGVSDGLVRQWLSENMARPIKAIPHHRYAKLYPFIREHLPADARYHPAPAAPAAPAAPGLPPPSMADFTHAPASIDGEKRAYLNGLIDAMPPDEVDEIIRAIEKTAARLFMRSKQSP